MNSGDRIFLPVTVEKFPSAKAECTFSDEEMKFLHSLILYKVRALEIILGVVLDFFLKGLVSDISIAFYS